MKLPPKGGFLFGKEEPELGRQNTLMSVKWIRETLMKLDYSTPFGYFFQEKGWPKALLVASLLTFTLIGAAPVLGWTIEITRRVAENETPLVPDWSDWKLFWRLGGQFAFVNILWLLPLLAAVLGLYAAPAILIRVAADEAVLLGFGATLLCVILFLLVYSTAYIFFLPVMMGSLAENASIRAAANPFRLWRAARTRLLDYLLVFLLVGVALFNAAFLAAALTLFLLLPPLLVYLGLVTAHFAGQLARREEVVSGSQEA